MSDHGLIPFVYDPSLGEQARWRLFAMKRNDSAKNKGLSDRHGAGGSGLGLHIQGVAGEWAMAAFQGLLPDWEPTVDTFHTQADVDGCEVRCRGRHTYDLLIRPDDRDEARFVLATMGEDAPLVYLWGWCFGHEAKQDRFLAHHGGRAPAWFVPKAELHPLDLIPWKGIPW